MTIHLAAQDDVLPALAGILMVIGIYSVFGIICAVLAPGRGRSAVGWFFIGVATQCIGIILILLLPNLKAEEEKERRRAAETKRLREQLKKERQVADERHEAHRARIGTHDLALGIDTSEAENRLLTNEQAAAAGPPPLPGPEAVWYYAANGQQRGPVPQSQLLALLRDGGLDAQALAWTAGMTDWAPIARIPALGRSSGDSGPTTQPS
jgi:hypothetical protein